VTHSFEALLAAVRKACLPGLWSQGVKLAREGAVFDAADEGDTTTVRVAVPGKLVAPTVTLYPEDAEWSCDCGGKVDPCPHVAAAAIALAQGNVASVGSQPDVASTHAPSLRLRYRLERKDGLLSLGRFVVHPDGREEALRGSLASPSPQSAALHPTHDDLGVDRYVGTRQHGFFPKDRVPEVFGALSGVADLLFEGEPIRTSKEPLAPRAVIEDEGASVVVTIDRDPRVSEIVVAGIARVDGVLHPLAETELTGGRLERLPLRRVFSREQLAELVTDVLPGLEKRMAVDVRSKRLPKTGGVARPRIALELVQEESTLAVLPTVVYGDPPVARVDDGRLVHLGGPVPARDEPAERALVAKLRDELHLVPGRRVTYAGGDAVRFAQRLQGWSGKDAATERAFSGAGRLVPRLSLENGRFDLSFELESDADRPGKRAEGAIRRADAAAVVRAWQEGLPLVPLEGGGFAPLPSDFLAKHGERVSDLLEARRDDGTVSPAVVPVLGELCEALETPPPANLARLAPLVEGFAKLPDPVLPADLTATLRPYQTRGVAWLEFLRDAGLGAVLADDMGLGKTLQTLCAVRGRTLVVCPRSVVHNWADEIRRFRPALRVALYHGPKRALDPKADVTLTTYAVLRLDADALAAEIWDTLVLDEAQAIKNPESQVTRAAYALRAHFRVSLSGTPVENRLDELWSQLHFTNRGLLGGRSSFVERWARPIENGTPDAAARLRKKIRPFVLRRMKAEVAPELPPRSDAVLYCELEESERAVYDAVRAATQRDIVARFAEGASVLAALEALLRLRQAACHPSLVPGQHADGSSKIARLVEALEDAAADGHKALVFSQWTSLLDLVEPALREAGVPFVRLDGSTVDRAGVVARFQDPNGPPVMLISLKAGGTGLNLTAADHVFLLDPWWNPAVEDQAADRAHRIGQDRPVFVYRLVAKDTVEEKILALQQKKRAIADAALGEADRAAALTREDLLELLS
jgi:hypothetical protein